MVKVRELKDWHKIDPFVAYFQDSMKDSGIKLFPENSKLSGNQISKVRAMVYQRSFA